MSGPPYAYHAYGLQVRSSVALPLAPHALSSRPDVTVRLGTVSGLPAGPGPTTRTDIWHARPGAFLLHIEGVARYLVTGGRDVLIEPQGDADADAVAAFCIPSVFAILLQQRDVVTLHAAAVETGSGAVLLLGKSGVGKSSLAAALVERGCSLLADEVTGLVLDKGGRAMALPAFPAQRLWAHTLDKMDWRARAGRKVRRGLEKYWLSARRFCTTPQPVCAAFELQTHALPGSDILVEPATPGEAFWMLWHNTHRKRVMDAMGRRPRHFATVSMMARHVPVARVRRPAHIFLLDALADRIEAHLRSSADRARTAVTPRHSPRPSCANGSDRAAAPSAVAAPAGGSGPGIVWLASYPKSGNTWLRAVLTNYVREGNEPVSINALVGEDSNNRDVFNEYLGIDSADMTREEVARHLPRFRAILAERFFAARPLAERRLRRHEPTFVKTHEVYREPGGSPRFPRAGTVGVAYLVRNPLDVAVSYAHHLFGSSIDEIIEMMNDPTTTAAARFGGIFERLPEPMGTWSMHVRSWMDQHDLPVLVVRYEDLLKDPLTGFRAIVRLAGLDQDAARLDRAVRHSTFSRLRDQEEREGFNENPRAMSSFFRAGVAGSWRTVLTRAQVRALVDAHAAVMRRLGYLCDAEAFLRA